MTAADLWLKIITQSVLIPYILLHTYSKHTAEKSEAKEEESEDQQKIKIKRLLITTTPKIKEKVMCFSNNNNC